MRVAIGCKARPGALQLSNIDWHNVRFLESAANLKPLLKRATGRTASTRLVREVGACLQQGRAFYESAALAPIDIRPLLLFYGFVAFARAIVIGRSMRPLESLPQSHGISDVSKNGARIRDLEVRIGSKGTFQAFNDVVRNFSRVPYFGRNQQPAAIYLPSSGSSELSGLTWSLPSVLSRVPALAGLYGSTFDGAPNTEHLSIHFWPEDDGFCDLRIDDSRHFGDRAGLREMVQHWRGRYPFLERWRFRAGTPAWGNSILEFCNLSNEGVDEFSDIELKANGDRFEASNLRASKTPRLPLASILSPLAGGFGGGSTYAVAPLGDLYPSEFSFQFLALFLLSSVVRYRPDTWAHAISRSATQDRPADDEMLAILEQFMEAHSSTAEQLVVVALNSD